MNSMGPVCSSEGKIWSRQKTEGGLRNSFFSLSFSLAQMTVSDLFTSCALRVAGQPGEGHESPASPWEASQRPAQPSHS